MTEFIKSNDLVIIENENEFIIRKGFLHINEIIIDKAGSSKDFVVKMEEFNEKGKINLKESDLTYDDFMQLTKFGLVNMVMNKDFLLITNKEFKDVVEELCGDNVKVKFFEEIFENEDILNLTENKSTVCLNALFEKYKNIFSEFNHIYYLEHFCNLSRLRAFNRLMNKLDIETTIGFLDNNNIYLTGVKPKYTGCYECLEKHIITKFTGTINDYSKDYKHLSKPISDKSDICLLMGLVLKDMDNINKYSSSSLTGNVIHFYTPNFEYSFNVNRKNISCSVCSKLNNVLFEEQNIRSVNVIKEVYLNDKD